MFVKTMFTFKENLKSTVPTLRVRFETCVLRFKVLINFRYF